VNRFELLDSQPIPGTDQFMRLLRRGSELVIHVGSRELMSTRMHGSEDALADLAWDALRWQQREEGARILIGGLGIGYTAAAALRRAREADRVTVAELVPAVVMWNRGILGEAAEHPLNDPRLSVYEGDVADLIETPPSPFDAILLDVDNGPSALTRDTNSRLYTPHGLQRCASALRPGGVLGVWSAFEDDLFIRRMMRAGFSVTPHAVRARGRRGGRRHTIFIGTVR